MDKVYSENGEEYHNDDFYEVVQRVLNEIYPEKINGQIISIWEAEIDHKTISDFYTTMNIVDELQESAYDAGLGDHSENWLDVARNIHEELNYEIKQVLEKWADKHKLQPAFFGVKNEKEIKIKLIEHSDADGYKYDIV